MYSKHHLNVFKSNKIWCTSRREKEMENITKNSTIHLDMNDTFIRIDVSYIKNILNCHTECSPCFDPERMYHKHTEEIVCMITCLNWYHRFWRMWKWNEVYQNLSKVSKIFYCYCFDRRRPNKYSTNNLLNPTWIWSLAMR